jgi:BolA protein
LLIFLWTLDIALDLPYIVGELTTYTKQSRKELQMSMQQTITDKLGENIQTSMLDVVNESSNHNVPPGSESHFKVTLVSDDFDGKTLLARHRIINKILENELNGGIHALAIHAYTQQEWDKLGASPVSPPCLGGGK